MARRWYARSARLADAWIFQNADDHAEFLARGLLPPRLPVTVLPGAGVDLGRFPRREPPPQGESPRFLFVGRLLGDKGVRELAAAARILRERGVAFRLRLVGPFDENPSGIPPREVRAWIDEGLLEAPGRVEDVRPELAACDVFVLPSYREGSPNATVEALATGRAIVTTDVPGCRATVVAGVNGLVVPPRDVRGLAEALATLARDPAAIRRMGEASRRLAEERFDARAIDRSVAGIVVGSRG